ncbi:MULTISPECIES: homoserine kinase [unclassified Clostridium]|uniref:homoserine kinase n=1 Tax=unclassified Clostridium TaxID=2614128 RepID=UPI0018993DE3|nr:MULTISPECIES: homoserine kinase [unclassified Clostridium]MCR1950155.1 homoserine kinase [Clostridium sp. DSM 100503]
MIRVRVPATSANIGPGFDSLGIAFNLYNEYEFSECEEGINFDGFKNEFCNEENIVYKAMNTCFEKYDFKPKGLNIKLIKEDIPISRGLGSSSSCIVAGLLGANYIMKNKLSIEELFKIGVDIEGHPDNIAPAFFGGMVVSVMEEKDVIYNKIDIKEGISFIALIPKFELSTAMARKVLPVEVKISDAIYNISRVSLMISSFVSGKYELLKYCCKDAIHEKYRIPLIKDYNLVYNKCISLGALGCFLSGAGPTIMSIIKSNDTKMFSDIKDFLKNENINWDIKELYIDNNGATIFEGDTNEGEFSSSR